MQRGERARRRKAEDGAASAETSARLIGRSAYSCGAVQVAVVSHEQAIGKVAVPAIRRGAKIMDDLESGTSLADPEQHPVVVCSAREGSTIEKSVISLHQGGRGLIAVHVVPAAVWAKSKEQRELAGGRDFEQSATLRVR